MSTTADVLSALRDLVFDAVYPNGVDQPSVAGVDVTIFPGWPVRNKLDNDMTAGKAQVSIFPTNKISNHTKFLRREQTVSIATPTITTTVVNNTVTIGGTVSVPQAVMILVNGIGYGYQVLLGNTLDDIATALAALIPGASAAGSVIIVPGAHELIGRIAVQATTAENIGQTDREFMICCWCPTPEIRNLLASPIEVTLRENYRIMLADGFEAQTWFCSENEMDDLELQKVFRRDFYFKVRYSTTLVTTTTTITDPFANIDVQTAPLT